MAILLATICCVTAKADDEFWSKLQTTYNNMVEIWGYNMSSTTNIERADFWSGTNYKKGVFIDCCGGSYYLSYSYYNYTTEPYVRSIDETNQIEFCNFLKDFEGLFTDSDKTYVLIGDVDESTYTITFQPQLYADGCYFAHTPSEAKEYYSIDDMKSVTINYTYGSEYSILRTGTGVYQSVSNQSFAIYEPTDVDGQYIVNMGYCDFNLRGEHHVITYDFGISQATVYPLEQITTSIEKIRLLFSIEGEGTQSAYINENCPDVVKLYRNGKETDVTVTLSVDESNDIYGDLVPSETLTEPGVYSFVIPAGLIGDYTYKITNFTAGSAIPEITLTYKINGPDVEYDLEPESIAPTADEAVKHLSVITLTFADEVGINEECEATIDVDGISIAVAISEEDESVVILTLSEAIAANGVYTITIPQGMIGDENYIFNNETGHANAEITLTYTVHIPTVYNINITEVSPTVDSTIDELTSVTITFSEPVSYVGDGISLLVDNVNADIEISVTVDGSVAVLTLAESLIDAGNYTFVIAEGAFGDDAYIADNTTGKASVEAKIAYTVSGVNGLSSISINNNGSEAEVYNLQGQRIYGSTLAPGIYIIKSGNNVQKVCVK